MSKSITELIKEPGRNKLYRNLVGAAIVVAVIVVGYVLLAGGSGPLVIKRINPDQIVSLTINTEEDSTELTKEGERWYVAGGKFAADEKALNQLISIVSELQALRRAPGDEADLYGLDSPSLSVTVGLAKGDSLTITVGSQSKDGFGFYGKLDDANQVYILPGNVVTGLRVGLIDVIDKHLLDLSVSEPVHIELEGLSEPVVLSRTGGEWLIESPYSDQGNQTEIQDLLESFASLTIQDMIETPEDYSKYGLDEPRFRLKVTFASGETKEILLGNKPTAYTSYATTADDETVFIVGDTAFQVAALRPFDLVEDDAIDLPVDEVVQITVKRKFLGGSEENIEIEKRGGGWYSLSTRTGEMAIAFNVDKLLDDIDRLGVVELGSRFEDNSWGFYPAEGSLLLTLDTSDGDQLRVDISRSTDGRHNNLRVTGRDAVYATSEIWAKKLHDLIATVNTSIITLDADAVTDVTFMHWNEETVQQLAEHIDTQDQPNPAPAPEPGSLTKKDGVWLLNRSVAFGVGRFLNAIPALEAAAMAPEVEDPTEYGFSGIGGTTIVQDWEDLTVTEGTYDIRITIDETRIIRLEFGNRTEDGQYVYTRTSNQPGIYMVEAEMVDRVITAYNDIRTTLFGYNPADVVALKLSSADATAEIRRDGDVWKKADGSSVDGEVVDTLLTSMRELSATEVATKPEGGSYGFVPEADGIQVVVEDAEGSTEAINVGKKVKIGSGWFATYKYYVQLIGDPQVWLVKDRDLQNAALNHINKLLK